MSVHAPLDSDAHPRRGSRLWAATGAGAVLAAAGAVVAVTITAGSPDTLPVAQAAPSTTSTSSTTSAPATTSGSAAATTSASASASAAPTYKPDSKGYANTKARCDDTQTVMAYGRTERSLAVICVNPDGKLEYRGLRLRDDAAIQVSASRGADGTIIADNDGVTYSISPTVFLVSEGDSVIYRDSWIEFQQPGFSGERTSSASTAATATTSPTATVSTTTVTVTTSVTATTSKSGN
ncbi:hypothetical protein MANY_14320 [Mycolicibacterium anyangense]|uniref:Protein kinase n=1 Tax=Mycolicibacterium anyangense TaxID=1431246 RepID=A0A6N4W5W3_9MYCO|nr:hypothetical protein [Mycolicibacterium anyangense]BBZ76095.1 hypothetical protein MANY_14320 [Mycolicibacterium anyangense]